MLNNNKTYDNSNFRDRQKTFNAGIAVVYEADERAIGTKKGEFFFSKESLSYDKFLEASNNSQVVTKVIGIPEAPVTAEHGDIVEIDGEYYTVDHSQYKDFEVPHWYKVFLKRTVIPYE